MPSSRANWPKPWYSIIMMDGMTTASQTTYTDSEMFSLLQMHFSEVFSERDYTKWDWSLPLYLIEGVHRIDREGSMQVWTESSLATLVDFYHNGPSRCR